MSAFDHVIGYCGIKKELEQISDTLKNREIYEKLGVMSPRGLLLHGEPGVGKTLMASALIEESGRKVFVCRKDKPNGDFIREIKAIFDKAVQCAPSIVFLDDMDKFANGDERHRDAEEYVTVQSCIDECRGKEVFVLATVNNMRVLPRSLTRSGRFDRTIEIKPPTGKDAEAIIAYYLSGKKFVSDIDVPTITRILDGRSCAQLETVINEAGLIAGYERSPEITMDHFIAACLRVIYGKEGSGEDDDFEDLAFSNSAGPLSQIIYHEVGHAVVSEILVPGSISLVSVQKNAVRNGAFTAYYMPQDCDTYVWKISRIIGALAGTAAVEQKFGVADMGNSEDLQRAMDYTQQLIIGNGFCGISLVDPPCRSSSEELLTRQERVASAEVYRYYRYAKEILIKNNEFFEKLAAAVAQKGTIHYRDIQSIRASCKIIPISFM